MIEIPRIALSIMQPWAWLIVNGHKSIENRNWKPWNPGLKFRGEFAVHAGKKVDKSAHEDVVAGIHPVTGERTLLGIEYPPCFGVPIQTGGIVGVMEIIGDITKSDDEWFVGPYGLVIRNARPVPFVPAKGALGFFDWRKNVVEVQPRATPEQVQRGLL